MHTILPAARDTPRRPCRLKYRMASRAEELARQVHGYDRIPVVQAHFGRSGITLQTRIGDQDIYRAERLDRAREQSGDVCFAGHVRLDRYCTPAGRIDLIGEALRFLAVKPVVDHHRGARRGERASDGDPDPRTGAGDNCHLIGQRLACAAVAVPSGSRSSRPAIGLKAALCSGSPLGSSRPEAPGNSETGIAPLRSALSRRK
jgi:hypothetical protein